MMQKLDELQIRLVRAAALRGAFEPRALLHEVLGPEEYKNKVLRARLLSSLLELCSVEQSGKHAQWLLRPAPRERALAELDSDSVATTGETTDIALALAGQDPFTLETLDSLIDAGTSEETLSQLVVTLERAGQKASSYDRLFGLRSRLNMLRQSRQTDALLLDDFVGRLDEVKRIEAWIAKPQHKLPLKTLHIEGLPGIGKSFLLERITQIARAQDDLILIKLDFDRSSLQASDGGMVFDEISRQIGYALPRCAAKLRDLRLSHSEQVTRQAYESSDPTPRQLLHAMIDAVADANRSLVFLLDTLEVLHSQGSTYVQIMMEELDRFAEKGRIGISVISAGRGPIFTKDNPRLGKFISLETLEDELINTTLEKHGIAEGLRPRIVAQAGGNPLKLRLLIDQAQQNSNVTEEANTSDQMLAAGFVHRAIRSRLPPALRRIASEGLVLSELTTETLTRVVMPALGIGNLERNAAELIDDLGQQRWLVSDDGMGRLTHQPDLRQAVLEHTYRDSPLVAAEVNRAARDFFADRDPVLNLYHGLQLMRLSEAPPDIDSTLAERFPERLMRELPVTAQDLIRRARGQRSATVETSGTRKYETIGMEVLASSAPDTLVQIDARSPIGRARIVGHGESATPDARALNDLRLMLEQGQRREATQILREGLHSAYDPASEIGVLIMCHQWQSGFWSKARELFDVLPRDLLPDLVAARPQLEGRIILEILAEFDFGRLVERLADDSFRQRVVGVVNSSTGIGLRAAALDFALLAAGVPYEDMHQALGLIAPYLEGGAAELAHERLRSAQGIRSDFGIAFSTPDLPIDGRQVGQYAMALAPLNPYHDRLHALVSEFMASGRGRVLDDMHALHGGLHEAAELFAPGHEGVDKAIAQTSDRPTDILALLRALGLTADWAEGYSFFHPIADLPTIARAASRWQQVVGGHWAYDGPEPKGWHSKVQFSQRSVFYAELVPTDDSARITDRMLRFWSDPGNIDSTAGTDTIRRRLGPTSQVLKSLTTRFDRLRHLSESRAPTVFHPALALIAEADRPPRFLETVALRRPTSELIMFVPQRREYPMNGYYRESMNRLEAMGNAGMIDNARNMLDANPAILQEMGLTPDRALEILGVRIDKLESVGSTPSQLEAIVRAVGRPPLIVRGGKVEGKQSLSADFPADIDICIGKVEPFIASVGRIEFINHDYSWGGTGWVIEKKNDHLLIITNRHVAKLVARRSFMGDGVFMFAPGNARYGAKIDFLKEVGATHDPDRLLSIEKFTYIAEDAAADIALARIALPGQNARFSPEPIPLAAKDAKEGECVAVIGFPAKDSLRNDPTQMANYFNALYDVKRFSPGFLKEAGGMTILRHDCTTLGGNSGSPVISLYSGKAVGLHYAGTFGVGNSAVRISTVNALLDGATPISVPGTEIGQSERPDGSHSEEHFNGRVGYDPHFLQLAEVPLPSVPKAFGLVEPSDKTDARPQELRYQNFGVLYSATLKTPIVAALNIDGSQTRPQKRGNDKWFADLRIPADIQLSKEDYNHSDVDRGHLIRRAATNWGTNDAQAKLSNDDSFHYTVAAPQHRAFNRSQSQWLGLEDFIMNNVRTHGFRACVFTGPIITGDEPLLKDTGAVVPLKFFKLVTMLAEQDGSNGILRLHATAYVLSQVEVIQQLLSDQGRVEAVGGFEFGSYKTFQVRISDLETMTRLDFRTLRDSDPLAARVLESEALGASPRPVVEITDFSNVVL